jgi:hypothetical protein
MWHRQRVLFAIVVCISGYLLAVGLFVLPMKVHFQLDVILSPEELRDEKTRVRTLEILEKASQGGKEGFFVAIPAAVMVVVGLIGLFVSPPRNRAV